MSRKIACGTAALLMGTLCLGCTSTQSSIRGQNPSSGTYAQQDSRVALAGFFGTQQGFGHGNQGGKTVTYAGPGGQSTFHPHKSHCPFCQGHGQPGGCPQCQCEEGGPGWYPTHVNRFSYRPPQDNVYPQQNTPAAVVQYPYYTVRGPTDYFMK